MPNARAIDHQDQANDAPSAKGAVSQEARPKRQRAKPASAEQNQASSAPKKVIAPQQDIAQVALVQARKSASPLLVGAGIGAALALSVVALRSRDRRPTVALFASPNATFFNAVVKTIAFAVAQTTAKGSLTSLVARAVGKAVA